MCGIVAYSGNREAVLPTLISGLKRLEYRGYDSAGIAVFSNNSIYNKKEVGKIVSLEKAIDEDPPMKVGNIGIAHTRWATHGPATARNAHPHASEDKKIWVVHNGIIENYRQIKERLEKEGTHFESDTDTEVIAKLVGSLYTGDLRKAVLDTIKLLTGAYAVCVICEDEPDRLIGVKMSSPLVVGIANNEVIIASDVSAIVERTKKVIYLEDGELIDIKNTDYDIVGFDDQIKEKNVSEIDWDVETATKGGHEHYLLKEIVEQPQVIKDSIRGRIIDEAADVKLGGLIDVQPRLKDVDHVVILGVGTSFYSAKMGELYFNALSGIPATAVLSPEYRYTKNIINDKTWLIAMSQSGETADTIAAINEAKKHGALVTGIVNTVGSSVARITDAGVYNHIGPEISVASTKAFTSQSVLLLMHAMLLGRQKDLDYATSAAIINAIKKLPSSLQQVIDGRESIEVIAKIIYKDPGLLYIGRQYNYPIALEGALKVKELAYIHAEGLSGGELKHGFIALIDDKLSTIALVTKDSVIDKMEANIAEIKARNGRVIAVANQAVADADATVVVPDVGSELLQPLVNNVVLQLLAYYVAKLKKLNVDQPRNLAKSVTVE